jgi:hypothetical protein
MRGVVLALAIVSAFILVAWISSLEPPQRAEAGACVAPQIMGDLNGNRAVDGGDALWVLRKVADLPLPGGGTGCSPEDVDCLGQVSAVDALKVMRHVAGLPVLQIGPEPDDCQDIGTFLPL